jgi:ribulose-phosphate 3-epimerase
LSEIIPAIIAKNFEEVKEKIKLVEPFVNWVQLDIMDGKFVPEKTWNNPVELANIDKKLNVEAHLMVEDVISEVERWVDSGVKRMLVHVEPFLRNQELGIRNWELINKKCEESNIELGLVLNLETSVDVLSKFPFSSSQLFIQLMSIAKIGYHGHPFDEKVIHKIELLRRKWLNVRISLDGGLNGQVLKKIAKVGVDNYVVGSAIFNSKNIKETIEKLKLIIDN